MKILIYLLTFLFSINLSAGWISEIGIQSANIGNPGITVYKEKGQCELKDKMPCYEIQPGQDASYYTIKDIEVDDFSKPIFAAAMDIESCESECYQAYQNKQCTDPDYYSLYGDLDEDGKFETWCTKHLGFERKVVQQLKEDVYLKGLVMLARQKAIQDKQTAQEAHQQRLSRIQNCISAIDMMETLIQMKACLKDLLTETLNP
jgi:hypothetical protein